MGVIQNSVNQVLGIAGLATKGIKDSVSNSVVNQRRVTEAVEDETERFKEDPLAVIAHESTDNTRDLLNRNNSDSIIGNLNSLKTEKLLTKSRLATQRDLVESRRQERIDRQQSVIDRMESNYGQDIKEQAEGNMQNEKDFKKLQKAGVEYLEELLGKNQKEAE